MSDQVRDLWEKAKRCRVRAWVYLAVAVVLAALTGVAIVFNLAGAAAVGGFGTGRTLSLAWTECDRYAAAKREAERVETAAFVRALTREER